MKNIFKLTSLAAAFALILCSCVDISHREMIPQETQPPQGVGGDLLLPVSTEESTPEETEAAANPILTEAEFSAAQQEFIGSCFFMGDSICSGLGANGLVPLCCAKAGVAARNIEEFTFDYGGAQLEPLTAIVNSERKNLVFMMGINDVNIENTEEFKTDYDSFLNKVSAMVPDAVIYLLSIPPVTENSSFCYNYNIDEFNEKIEELAEGSASRHYIDISKGLKNSSGALYPEYAMEDGLHLLKAAYYSILRDFCESAGVE